MLQILEHRNRFQTFNRRSAYEKNNTIINSFLTCTYEHTEFKGGDKKRVRGVRFSVIGVLLGG